MSDHTPDTEEVAYYYEGPDLDAGDRRAAFDRWLAETIRQAKAEAWEEGLWAGAIYHPSRRDFEDVHLDVEPVPPANPYAEEGQA